MQNIELTIPLRDDRLLTITDRLTDNQIEQLVYYAKHDPEVLENTGDKKRFPTFDVARAWTEGKAIYGLTHDINEDADLLGIIWFEKMKLPRNVEYSSRDFDKNSFGITFAVRIYSSVRGKGLLEPFVRKVLANFLGSDFYRSEKQNGIWLRTSNEKVIRTCSKDIVGFRQISKPDTEGKILMIHDPVTEMLVGSSG